MQRMMRYIALTALLLAGIGTVMHGQTGDCYDNPSDLIHIPGCFDSTFGTNGLVTTASLQGVVRDVAIQNIGGEQRIVAVGSPWAIARYRPTGSLDDSFSVGGIVRKTKGYSIQRVVIQPGDSKFVVGGFIPMGKSQAPTLAVTRLWPTGAYDMEFGSGGTVAFAPPSGTAWSAGTAAPAHLALQSDGKIVVVGYAQTASESKIIAARLTPTGTLDTTFGAGGYFSYGYLAGKLTNPTSLAAQTVTGQDGQPELRFVIVAEAQEAGGEVALVIRLTANGVLDTTFAGTGVARLVVDDVTYFTGVAVDASNRIVAVGQFFDWDDPLHKHVLAARYLQTGTLDPSFGTGGTASEIWGAGAGYRGIAIQPDGSILAHGTTYENATAAWRILPDGTPDRGFGAGGWVTTSRLVLPGGLALMQRPADGYDTFVQGGFVWVGNNKKAWVLARSIR